MPPAHDASARAPSAEELLRLPAHVVVRDLPETLAVFRAHGVDLRVVGGRTVAHGAPDAGVLAADLARATAWRADLTGR